MPVVSAAGLRGSGFRSGRGPIIGSHAFCALLLGPIIEARGGEEDGVREQRGGRASKEFMDKFRREFYEENIEIKFLPKSYVSIFPLQNLVLFRTYMFKIISSLWNLLGQLVALLAT